MSLVAPYEKIFKNFWSLLLFFLKQEEKKRTLSFGMDQVKVSLQLPLNY